MLPKWLYKIAKQRADNKQLQNFGLYTKQPNVLKDHIVFIGDHHQYIGNSKYLFTYFVKHNPMTACYFVTDDRRGPHFISPKSERADELINSARVVIVENDIPETLQPNGTLIQLHQGTPIMQLFLDSKEPIKNIETPFIVLKGIIAGCNSIMLYILLMILATFIKRLFLVTKQMYWLMVILNTNIYYKSVTKVLLNNSIRNRLK